MVCQILWLVVILAGINISWYCFHRKNSIEFKKKEDKLRETKQELGQDINEDELKDEVEPNTWYTWVFGLAVCLNVWIIGAIITHLWASYFFNEVGENDSNKALFGDSFGAVNALISAFAFGGMIVTFFFQRYELKLQRKELQDQRKEFERQNQTLGLQRFENTFFNMLQLQQEIVAGLEYKPYYLLRPNRPIEPYRGREVFKRLFEGVVKPKIENEGIVSYNKIYDISILDHYFRHLYTILNYIDKSPDIARLTNQAEEDIIAKKYEYTKILRATLSRYELVLLFYNGLSLFGKEKLKPLIEKYSMLNNINEDLLALCNDFILFEDKETRKKFEENCGKKEYPPTDYLFCINDEKDTFGYNVSAFYHQKEDQEIEMEKKTNFNRDLNELKYGDFSDCLFDDDNDLNAPPAAEINVPPMM